MRVDNYQCDKCSKIVEYQAKKGEGFPDSFSCECGEKGILERMSSVPYTDVAQGHLGNAKNEYKTSSFYTSSRMTPMNILQSSQKRSDSGI
jgi:hypothetical protein